MSTRCRWVVKKGQKCVNVGFGCPLLRDEAIVKFLSDSGVAFRVVDLDSYKEMLKITNDKVQVKSRSYHSKFVTMKA